MSTTRFAAVSMQARGLWGFDHNQPVHLWPSRSASPLWDSRLSEMSWDIARALWTRQPLTPEGWHAVCQWPSGKNFPATIPMHTRVLSHLQPLLWWTSLHPSLSLLKVSWGLGDGLVSKIFVLLCKHEDQSSGSRTPHKIRCSLHICNPSMSTGRWDVRTGRSPEAHEPASLVRTVANKRLF